MADTTIRRTTDGVDAVDAALDEIDLRERLDETDPSYAGEGDYDLSWVRARLADEVGQRASTPDEAIEEIAAAVGHESPWTEDDDYDY